MPRKIPKNYRHITGLVADGSGGALPFEGPLEIDFYTIMSHHRVGSKLISSIETQSITIEHLSSTGRRTRYTPEALIHFDARLRIRPVLVEVKPIDTLIEKWDQEIELKVRAGTRHARRNGWTFKVYTEREVRTPYLENVKLLRIHRGHQFTEADLAAIQERVEKTRGISFEEMLVSLEKSKKGEARQMALSKIYHLLAHGRISADLFRPIGYKTQLLPIGNWEERPWDKRWLRSATPPRPAMRKGW